MLALFGEETQVGSKFKQNSQLGDDCSSLQITVSENRRKQERGKKWSGSDTFGQERKKD